jgi:hypothetical protein
MNFERAPSRQEVTSDEDIVTRFEKQMIKKKASKSKSSKSRPRTKSTSRQMIVDEDNIPLAVRMEKLFGKQCEPRDRSTPELEEGECTPEVEVEIEVESSAQKSRPLYHFIHLDESEEELLDI